MCEQSVLLTELIAKALELRIKSPFGFESASFQKITLTNTTLIKAILFTNCVIKNESMVQLEAC